MRLGPWSLTLRPGNLYNRTNLLLSRPSEWTLALQFRPQRSFWFRTPVSTFPDRLGRETRLTTLRALWCLDLTLASTTHRKMDMAHRLSWLRWWNKTRPKH